MNPKAVFCHDAAPDHGERSRHPNNARSANRRRGLQPSDPTEPKTPLIEEAPNAINRAELTERTLNLRIRFRERG
jgi:hypothetical protein